MRVFEFDYTKVHGRTLLGAMGQGAILLSNGIFAFDEVSLIFETGAIRASVNVDTDEVVLSLVEGVDVIDRWDAIDSLSKFLGQPLGWGWSARNSNGYRDLVMFSFDGISPQIGFLGEASRISVISINSN